MSQKLTTVPPTSCQPCPQLLVNRAPSQTNRLTKPYGAPKTDFFYCLLLKQWGLGKSGFRDSAIFWTAPLTADSCGPVVTTLAPLTDHFQKQSVVQANFLRVRQQHLGRQGACPLAWALCRNLARALCQNPDHPHHQLPPGAQPSGDQNLQKIEISETTFATRWRSETSPNDAARRVKLENNIFTTPNPRKSARIRAI